MTATSEQRKRRRWWMWLIPLGAIPVLVIVVAAITLKPYRIPSETMVPTLEPKDRIVVRRGGDAEVGDIVVVRAPTGATGESAGPQCGQPVREDELCAKSTGEQSDVEFVKRVVAEGGDRLALRDGKVIRNGKPVTEPYIRPCAPGGPCDFPKPITVPEGQVYLLGDNRGESDDSRFWGAVPESWVRGPVFARYWPPSRWGTPD